MGIEARKYWPFPILAEDERSDQHRLEIDYLENAYRRGHRPYAFGAGNYGATSDDGRSADIFVRGRARWEIALYGDDARKASAFVDDFSSAAAAGLSWLEGEDTATILARIEAHLAVMPGCDRMFVVYAH